MALIYFYDSTEIDKKQLTEGLAETDHHWEYVDEQLSINNIDPETEVLSVFVTSTVTADIIAALPKLKLIACRSTGFNNVDLQAVADRDIAIVNVPTYGEQTVAEYAFTLLLALSRKLPATLPSFDNDTQVEVMRGWDLQCKTIGVIGTGHIGKCAIKIAKGFGMNVIAYDPFPDKNAASELDFKYYDIEDLLPKSDVVSIHAPYFPSNHHLINEERLAVMKPSAVIVNTARGELIDTQALTQALAQKKIAGAALDVIEGEQLMHLDEEVALLRGLGKPTAELLQHSLELMALHKMPNVLLTPHNAFNTIEAIGRINSVTAENIIKFWYGETPNAVKKPLKQPGKLVIIRHTESEWNATGQWTGITDVHLSDKGFHDAGLLGQEFGGLQLQLDKAYCSQQIRTLETLEGILDASGQFDVPFERSAALNERDYGDYTGKNKWEVRDLVGEEKFQKIRRGWNEPVPGGETLKDVYGRVVPFYKKTILPSLLEGNNVLIVSHGNGIRSLIKYIESISDDGIEQVEMIFNSILVYSVDAKGKMLDKKTHEITSEKSNA